MADMRFERLPVRHEMQPVPRQVDGELGLVEVDATWGTIQPMQVADGVRTVGELEVIEHLRSGLPAVDSRDYGSYEQATIPGAGNVPFAAAAAAAERSGELSRRSPTVFFCNGPQCGQSPRAIRAVLDAGHPAHLILYYRGGLHDWVTLGLPLTSTASAPHA